MQVFAPAEQSGNPGDVINYQFVVANYQNTEDTFDLVLVADGLLLFQMATQLLFLPGRAR